MPKILSVGLDEVLLHTRNLVLHRSGAEVYSALVQSALALLDNEYFDVIVLCHTLSDEDRTRISRIVELFWPLSRMLLVGKFGTAEMPNYQYGVAFPWRLGPLALLELTRKLLAADEEHPAPHSTMLTFPPPTHKRPKQHRYRHA